MILSLLFCQAVLIGRGYSAQDVHILKPLPKDKLLLVAKKDEFTFVADLIDYASTKSIRLFVHDVKADYTAVSDGVMNSNGEIALKQIIGYDTADPLTVSVSCYKK